MTLDFLMYAFVVLCGPLAILVITRAFPTDNNRQQLLSAILMGWLLFTAIATVPRLGPFPGALFGILMPVIVVTILMMVLPSARAMIAGANVSLLVGLHVTRVAGGLFIPLQAAGRLSDPFASIAGWGDLLAATLAIPAAIIAWRARPGWENWVLGWNVIGFLDFLSAVTLGITSQPGSPLRLFFDLPGTALLGELPWRFIPSYFVPLYLMIHMALFIRLVPAVFGKSSRRCPYLRPELRHVPRPVTALSPRRDPSAPEQSGRA
jgi:hypothetical protein